MPWDNTSATRFTKKADTARLRKMWADVANKALDEGASDGEAVRKANGAVRDAAAKKRRRR